MADMVTMTVFITDARLGDRFIELRKEAFRECFVETDFHWQEFERDQPCQVSLARFVNGAHATATDESLHFVARKPAAKFGDGRRLPGGAAVRAEPRGEIDVVEFPP